MLRLKSQIYIYLIFYMCKKCVYISRVQSQVMPKTKNIVLLNTPHYKVEIKGEVEQSKKWNSALSYTSV